MTKVELVSDLASRLGITKAQAGDFINTLAEIAEQQLRVKGEFTVPGIVKLVRKDVAAKPARPGRNPATGEAITIPAKPATRKVVAKPVKSLNMAVSASA